MATFFMFGKYSSEAVKGMSKKRTTKTDELIRELGGEVRSMHALLGEYDLVFVVELPGIEESMKASVALSKMTGISFRTCPAVSMDEFDEKIIGT
jgi:uncharacterized protein with GYD domain